MADRDSYLLTQYLWLREFFLEDVFFRRSGPRQD